MKLSVNWFTEPVFDFEYKKYQLLGYLQQKQMELEANRIYPHIEELDTHIKMLEKFILSKNKWDDTFRKELTGLDLKNGKLVYQSQNTETGLEELLAIIHYSHHKITGCHDRFVQESEEIKKQIQLEILGLLPSYLREGFLLIRQQKEILVFNYSVQPVLDTSGEKKFHYQYLEKYVPSLIVNEESVKKEVIKKFRNKYDHPVFFQISTYPDFPIYETILPLTSKELNRWIS